MDNQINNKNDVKFKWPVLTIISYLISFVFIIIGFYKMLAYNSGEGWRDPVNAYVGGDAYNYIINANYATALFVLALIFVILGSIIALVEAIHVSTHHATRVLVNSSPTMNSVDSIDCELPPL